METKTFQSDTTTPAGFIQENRSLRIDTPLGKDAFLIRSLRGEERMSSLFHFELELVSEHADLPLDALVGRGATVSLATGDGDRHFHGIVSRIAQSTTHVDFTTYTAELVPWLWFLTRTTDCRIFQKLSVPEIVTKLFGEYGFGDFGLRLAGTYEPREYCVQYRETDFAFVSRLLEDEGIGYFFQHEADKHTLVLTDHQHPCPLGSTARFIGTQGGSPDADLIVRIDREHELQASRYVLTDFNFEHPSLDLSASQEGEAAHKYEIYDYPGGYGSRTHGERMVRIRQQEMDVRRLRLQGAGYCRQFAAGSAFTLTEHPSERFNAPYLLIAVSHRATQPAGFLPGDGDAVLAYHNEFECIPTTVPFRPARCTSRPSISGVQTAVVVGPPGEEVFCDRFGRVKVQFHWDREGRRNENSSCWLRVSNPWAGKGWGGISIPRIGQEVIVDFLEGDPDRPIITGRVYNAEQMPSVALPAGACVSGIRSDTLKGDGFNEITFNDTDGQERMYLHAEHDCVSETKHDYKWKVENDRCGEVKNCDSDTVYGDQRLLIGGHRTEKVFGAESHRVEGMRRLTVGRSQHVIVGGDHVEQARNRVLHVGEHLQAQVGTRTTFHSPSITASADFTRVDTNVDMTLRSGLMFRVESNHIEIGGPGGFIRITPAGITIQGVLVRINCDDPAPPPLKTLDEEHFKVPDAADDPELAPWNPIGGKS